METKLFIAAPISSFDNDVDYIDLRNRLLQIDSRIKEVFPNVQVTSEIINIQSMANSEKPAISAQKDFKSIRECTHFILIYPRKIVSSALIELGYAIALNKNALIISPDKDTLPFLAQELDLVYDSTKIEFLTDISEYEEIIFKFLV